MKKFFNVIRRNIFYIALIAGMVALVGLVALYNEKNRTEDELVEITEESEIAEIDNETATTEEAQETLGKTTQTEEASTDTSSEADEEEDGVSEEASATEAATRVESTEEKIELSYEGTADLIWPLSGNIIIPFSMETTVYFETLNQYKCNSGIVIEAQEDDEIVAAYKCEITSIESDAEYGNIIRASLGNGYEVTYGQLKDIYVSVGQVVEGGTVIATVASPTRYFTEEGTNLYFEITKDGTPVDPGSVIE